MLLLGWSCILGITAIELMMEGLQVKGGKLDKFLTFSFQRKDIFRNYISASNIIIQVQTYMSGSNIDKQIQQLINIRLGLEKHSDKIFSQLLKGETKDPLDSIYKTLVNKNLKIQTLENRIIQLENKLAKGNSFSTSTDNFKNKSLSPQSRSYDLPSNHESLMKNHEQNKKVASDMKQIYRARIQQFLIFLLKCIREVSRAQIFGDTDVKNLVDKLQRSLQKQSVKIIQADTSKPKVSAPSQVSTKISAQQNLSKLVKDLQTIKQPEALFRKISQSLGLLPTWQSFIVPIKEKLQYYQFIKKNLLRLQVKNLNQAKQKETKQFFQKVLTKKFHFSQIAQKSIQKVDELIVNSRNQIVSQLIQDKKNLLQAVPKQAFKLIQFTINHFYSSLDKLFAKHNQYPFQSYKRASYTTHLQQIEKNILNKNWDQAKKTIQDEIQQAFYTFERKTKYYSNNRIILRNTR